MQSRGSRNKKITPAGANRVSEETTSAFIDSQKDLPYRSRMRALFPALMAISLALPSYALSVDEGQLVRGKYTASGRASVSGITVRYLKSKAHVTVNGRVVGNLTRVVTSRSGAVLENGIVKLRGKCRSLSRKRGAFSAPTVLHIGGGDGATVRGTFYGLVNTSQKLSRYFRGKIVGSNNSSFLIRAR